MGSDKGKMRKYRLRQIKNYRLAQILLFFVFCFLFSAVASAQPISSIELINNAKKYDGKTIVYEGEVIGDVMLRGDHAWVNLNDGREAIGIWMDKGLTRIIKVTGSYKSRGDWLEVIGVFHRACPEHGGDLDIHAQSLRKVTPGKLLKEKVNIAKRNLVFIFLGVLCLIWILIRLSKKQSRTSRT